jgi:hypothetical protein
MLTEFEDTEVGLIVNRLKGGNIGSLCRKAVESHGKPNACFLLQGRNDAIEFHYWNDRRLGYSGHVPFSGA